MNNLMNEKMENNFRCLICKTFTTGSVAFQEHLMGSKHRKKLTSITAIKSLEPFDLIEGSEVTNIAFPFACKTCNKIFTGKVPYEQHLTSAQHLKRMSTKPQSGNAFPFTCETCAKNFTGEEPYQQHLVSALHLKKSQNLRNHIEDAFPFACDTCDKIFNGKEPYDQHLACAVHRKANMNTEDEVSVDADLAFPFSCLVCDKKFTGETPYREHMESTVHAKKVNLDPNDVFSCCKCELTFNGLIPYQQHLESLKHEIAIADPAMAKVLKMRRQLEYFQGGYRPEDIPCYRVDEPLVEHFFPFTLLCDEAQGVADKEFLAFLQELGK